MGAVIVVSGNLKETEKSGNPGGFDEQSYYACQHIFYLMKLLFQNIHVRKPFPKQVFHLLIVRE